MENQKYTYYAFISYKREDVRWAKWLQKRLESYGFPMALRKENPELPSRIRPVFRDQSELSGGTLKHEIERSLAESKYLVVICSPLSAKSPWVSKEVKYFIDNGREDDIIPFIISGSPNASDPEDECFPEGLRMLSGEKEILGININDLGREGAVVKVIARMFGIRFDTLWQRHERAKKKKRIQWAVLAIAIVFASFIVTGYMANLNRTITKERDRANEQTDRAMKAENIALHQRDSLKRAYMSLEIANDSIRTQSAIIERTNSNLILQTNLARMERDRANLQTEIAIQERDNAKAANWKMMENRARAVAEKANQLIDEGDPDLATLLCLEVLPKDLNNPEIPYVPEAEAALRRAADATTFRMRGYKHEHDVRMIASNDVGTRLASISDGELVIWYNGLTDDTTHKVIEALFPKCVVFSPDGSKIATGHYEYINIWDTETGELLKRIDGLKGWVKALSFTPDGKYLLSDGFESPVPSTIGLWNLNTGKCEKSFSGIRYVYSIRVSPDGKYLLNGSLTDTCTVWSMETQKCINTFKGHTRGVTSVGFSRDGRYAISASKDKTCKVWEPATGKIISILPHPDEVTYLSVSNKYNFVATACKDGVIRLWDFMNEEILLSVNVESEFNSFVMSPGDIPVVFYSNCLERNIIKRNTGMIRNVFGDFKVHDRFYAIERLAVSSDGNIIVAGKYKFNKLLKSTRFDESDGAIKYTRPDSIKNISPSEFTQDDLNANVRCIKFNPDNRSVAMGLTNGSIFIYDVDDNICKRRCKKNNISGLDYSPDGRELIFTDRDSLYVFDSRSMQELRKWKLGTDYSEVMAYSSTGRYIATGNPKIIEIWDAKDGSHFKTIHLPESKKGVPYLSAISFSPDDKVLMVSRDNSVFSIYTDGWYFSQFNLSDYKVRIETLKFSNDGSYLFVGTNSSVRIFKPDTMHEVYGFSDLSGGLLGYVDNYYDVKEFFVVKQRSLEYQMFPTLERLIMDARFKLSNSNSLTPEERKKYYLE